MNERTTTRTTAAGIAWLVLIGLVATGSQLAPLLWEVRHTPPQASVQTAGATSADAGALEGPTPHSVKTAS